MCAGKCVQMNLNPRDNCGACGKVCTGEEICNAKSLDWHDSRCVSCVDKGREQGANLHRCGGNTCINFDSLENCGGCGKVCRTRCTRGVCEP